MYKIRAENRCLGISRSEPTMRPHPQACATALPAACPHPGGEDGDGTHVCTRPELPLDLFTNRHVKVRAATSRVADSAARGMGYGTSRVARL